MKYEGFIGVVQARFPDADAEKFRALEALYLDWNAKINVISRKDMDGFYPHHVLHSLCIAAFLQEEMGTTRKRAELMVTVGCMLVGVICSLSLGVGKELTLFGMTVFDMFDFVTGQLFLPTVGFLTCIFIGWFVPHKLVHDEFSNEGTIRNTTLFHFYLFQVKYVCPICILFIFLHQLGLL